MLKSVVSRLVLVIGTLTASDGYAQAVRYRLTDLGAMNGPDRVAAISDSGAVVGWRVIRFEQEGAVIVAIYGGYVWDEGFLLELQPAVGARHVRPADINNANLIVGSVEYPNGAVAAAIFSPTEPARLIEGNLDWAPLSANGVNADGWIVGAARNLSGEQQAFVTHPPTGQFETLGTVSGESSTGLYINHSGIVIGSYRSGTQNRPFLWRPGSAAIDLNERLPATSHWTLIRANALSDFNVVVGIGLLDGIEASFQLNIDSGEDAQVLAPLAGDVSCTPHGAGPVSPLVGQSYWAQIPAARWTAVAWRGQETIDLNTVCDRPALVWFSAAMDVNSRGLIAVRGEVGLGSHHFRLEPLCPGDFDEDGVVGLQDLAMLLGCFGTSNCGDLDGNGNADLQDLAILLSWFGVSCS